MAIASHMKFGFLQWCGKRSMTADGPETSLSKKTCRTKRRAVKGIFLQSSWSTQIALKLALQNSFTMDPQIDRTSKVRPLCPERILSSLTCNLNNPTNARISLPSKASAEQRTEHEDELLPQPNGKIHDEHDLPRHRTIYRCPDQNIHWTQPSLRHSADCSIHGFSECEKPMPLFTKPDKLPPRPKLPDKAKIDLKERIQELNKIIGELEQQLAYYRKTVPMMVQLLESMIARNNTQERWLVQTSRENVRLSQLLSACQQDLGLWKYLEDPPTS